MLYSDVVEKLQKEYAILFRKAFPYLIIEPSTIEIVDHGLAKGDAESFLDCGLGISVRIIASSRPGSFEGYTGKFLAWLPNQFMPEHRHADIIAVPKNMKISYPDIIGIKEIVKDFKGIEGFDNKSYFFVVPESDKVLLKKEDLPEGCILIPGKAETFDIIYGDGSFFIAGEPTKNPKYPIPKSQLPYAKNRHEIYLTVGKKVELKPNSFHSAKAGPDGMVAIEYSLKSRDEADIFTHPKITRKAEIRER